jgi:hypothetical protein
MQQWSQIRRQVLVKGVACAIVDLLTFALNEGF